MKRQDFDIVREKGKFFRSANFTINYLQNDQTDLGIIVTKKISTKATDRNLIRRRIKEILRTNNLLKETYTYVIIVKSGILHLSFGKLETELKNAFKDL